MYVYDVMYDGLGQLRMKRFERTNNREEKTETKGNIEIKLLFIVHAIIHLLHQFNIFQCTCVPRSLLNTLIPFSSQFNRWCSIEDLYSKLVSIYLSDLNKFDLNYMHSNIYIEIIELFQTFKWICTRWTRRKRRRIRFNLISLSEHEFLMCPSHIAHCTHCITLLWIANVRLNVR